MTHILRIIPHLMAVNRGWVLALGRVQWWIRIVIAAPKNGDCYLLNSLTWINFTIRSDPWREGGFRKGNSVGAHRWKTNPKFSAYQWPPWIAGARLLRYGPAVFSNFPYRCRVLLSVIRQPPFDWIRMYLGPDVWEIFCHSI